jgi:hypothetical protein
MFAAVVCGGMLSACDGSPDQADTPTTAGKSAVAAKIAGLDPDMVAAVSAGKAADALGVHFAIRAVPTVDQPLTVDVAIVPHRDFTSVRAHFESRDGLTLTSGESFGPQNNALKEKAMTHKVGLQPAKDGLFMVTAIIETDGGDGTVTRVFSIPVIVNPTDTAAPPIPASNPATAATDASAAK